jgi:hypothetical protein
MLTIVDLLIRRLQSLRIKIETINYCWDCLKWYFSQYRNRNSSEQVMKRINNEEDMEETND